MLSCFGATIRIDKIRCAENENVVYNDGVRTSASKRNRRAVGNGSAEPPVFCRVSVEGKGNPHSIRGLPNALARDRNPTKYRRFFMTKQIELTQGQVALVDDEDFEYVNQFKWCFSNKGYAVRSMGKWPHQKSIRMHRVITNCPDNREVDHVNKNKLDNRKTNLRICNRSENNSNKLKYRNNKSGYKGVDFYAPLNKYRAQIKKDGKKIHIGYYDSPLEAASAYDKKSRELFGDFASTNA
jgi:hypothetical protein